MDVTFRPAEAGDVELLVEFMRELYVLDRLAFDERAARDTLKEILGDDSFGRVWLIQVEGSPTGYVALTLGFSLEFQGRDAFVDEIYVRAQHRGRGVGRRALEFVEGVCRSLGVRALHLTVGRDNTNAQAVYRKLGFEDQDSRLMTKRVVSETCPEGSPDETIDGRE